MYSLFCLKGSVAAIRAGITKQQGGVILPRASSNSGYGFLSTQRNVRILVGQRGGQIRSTGTANTYPTPRSVRMTLGALGSRSSLRRRRRICTSMLRSKTSS